MAESRVVRVSSPVYVLGDIHGNLHDIMVYERSLWKMGPTCLGKSFLFLGDYVDRGEHSVECILYHLCHKVMSPQKYWLLRGNHELRSVNQSFTFRNECLEKFGESVGQKLWKKFNTVFDFVPICAVIDESIYCAHGGIPTPPPPSTSSTPYRPHSGMRSTSRPSRGKFCGSAVPRLSAIHASRAVRFQSDQCQQHYHQSDE
ncbi:unnamed protein product [Oppiella nova]|uniref:Serine/threonine-protein phosphatase n=1 Tax=Oppiella nova TaxID=334625 RepID=A0A7R9MCK0_9ACAR|nr:unnamed protein product [Oppiella nova]CAG2174864.1 unnamed protein product [Oppiella nova]